MFVTGEFLYSQYRNKDENSEGTKDQFLYRRIFVKSVFVITIFDYTSKTREIYARSSHDRSDRFTQKLEQNPENFKFKSKPFRGVRGSPGRRQYDSEKWREVLALLQLLNLLLVAGRKKGRVKWEKKSE